MADYESIQIGIELSMIKKRPKTGKVLFQPLIGLKVNLYSCVAMNYFGEIKIVKRADDNDRE